MPRLSPFVSRCVFFLYGVHPKTGEWGGPRGTGVIIGMPRNRGIPYLTHYYAVTCQHVLLEGGHDIRLNTKDGKSRSIKIEPHEWQASESRDDLIATDITDRISRYEDDISAVPDSLLVSKKFAQEVGLDIGEDGFMVGLFADLPGKERNAIAARFGNISLLAGEPMNQGNGRPRPSHIFDMRSRPGFSGSPVFVYRTLGGDLRDITYGPSMGGIVQGKWEVEVMTSQGRILKPILTEQDVKENLFLRLLGIHSAQYHDEVEVTKLARSGKRRAAGNMEIPNSMTVVVPSWEISHHLQTHPSFVAARQKREEMQEKSDSKSAKPESTGASKSAPSTTADNPQHKEDFTRLLGAAVKKPRQDD